ncbi:Ferredoxin--NAD(P)(+) reductase fdr [Brevundimonas sp. SH203]|uniref:NAD(P)/FAD-dependent oxidoreductase n=1 Tax=Brevundimonas sp. SH203 TaxID=345167 RepID=UPI0009D5A8E9|nr:FAD-dependent oxidoreductase [Brevundimonas sp. SH203]GAW40315.1 Ferredoxin--NAD(P)(+) reductase fdr [Brevundimonas sp. SH203]
MAMRRSDVLIVGAGHGGAQTAIALRQQGFEGDIEIVAAQVEAPYERPALSKEYLSGDKSFDRLLIRPEDFWRERSIRMTLGRRVVEVSSTDRHVRLDDGQVIEFGALVWAAGGTPRRLTCQGHDADGVYTIREKADVDRLNAALGFNPRVVIIGGGYIGLEAAAVLAKSGKPPVLLEAGERVLARVSAEPLSRFFEAEHRRHGVDIRLSTSVVCIETVGARVSGVRLGDQTVLPAEAVIVGVGLAPAVEILQEAGAEMSDGVLVDALCRTSLDGVYAIGDCARHPNAYSDGGLVRLESVQNASDQAVTVARTIMGGDEPYVALPWFWSNQYDLKLQTLGLSQGHDQVVVRGRPDQRAFSVIYLRDGRMIAIDCVNAVKDYVQARAWILDRRSPDVEALRDPLTPLKAVPAVPAAQAQGSHTPV